MKRPVSIRASFLVTLLVAAGLAADVVLHPGTVNGTAAVSGWSANGGSLYLSNSTYSSQVSLGASPSFSLTVEGNQTYTSESLTLYFFASRGYLNISEHQSVTVPAGGTATLDVSRPGATVKAAFQVTGGKLVTWSPSIYGSLAGSDSFSFYESGPVDLSVPVEAGIPYHLQGTAQIQVADGAGGILCTATMNVPPHDRPALAEGATDTLTDAIAVDSSTCKSGIAGTVGVNGLAANSVTSGTLYVGGANGTDYFNWFNSNTYSYSVTKSPGDYYLFATLNFGGTYNTYLNVPGRVVTVTSGATARQDLLVDAVVASGNLLFSGSVPRPTVAKFEMFGTYDPAQPNGGPTSGAYSAHQADAAGRFNGVIYPGPWQGRVTAFYASVTGANEYQNLSAQDRTAPLFNAVQGSPLAVPDQKVALSTGAVVFEVVQPAGSPAVGISYPSINAHFSDSTRAYSLSASTSVSNAASPVVHLIGPPGHYNFDAYATVQGSSIHFAASTIDLGAAVDTPPGSDVVVVPKDSGGNPTPIQIDFSTVTTGGSTTVSTTDIGPAAPPDYNLLAVISGNKYVNINTSAQFPGKIEIGFKYDPAALGISAAQEQRLVLQQYLCKQSACAWVPINEVYNPHNPPYTDADALYFGRSNRTNPDTVNHIIYGVTTSLGTFALTYPKVVLVPPTDSCVGSSSAPAQLTTDPAACSAKVDNVNQRAGGCSGGGGGLASCLFDGLASEALGLGPHSVAIAGTAVDGSSATCTSYVTVADRERPAIACQSPAKLECTGPTTPYSAAATCTDNCGSCQTSCGSGPFPLGTTQVTCNATDPSGNKNSCGTSVTVVDTTPPALTLEVSPTRLWPPNHKMVPIAVNTTTADLCDPSPVVSCTATSSEPAADSKSPDIVWQNGALSLRAERDGNGPGRTYTVECTSADHSGNRTVKTAQVLVPHDQGK